MENGEDLFLAVIDRFAKGGVLSDIVLVGSWVLPIYRIYFGDAPEIPVLRTTDVDFLVGMPPRIGREFDAPAALSELGFEPHWSLQGDFCKYAHPDMEVEFLVPERGRGIGTAVLVDALHVKAQPLRYLSLAYERSMIVPFRGFHVRVPEPEAFVLLKLLVIPRRKDRAKLEKDSVAARSVGQYLMSRDERRATLRELLGDLPMSWQKTIRVSARDHFPELLEL